MHLMVRHTVTPLKKLSTLHAEPADVALDPPGEAALVRCLLRAGVPAWPVVMLLLGTEAKVRGNLTPIRGVSGAHALFACRCSPLYYHPCLPRVARSASAAIRLD